MFFKKFKKTGGDAKESWRCLTLCFRQSVTQPAPCDYTTLLNIIHTFSGKKKKNQDASSASHIHAHTHTHDDDDVNLHFKFTACAVTQSY